MRNKVKAFVQLLRPHQWIKNAFVFTGLIFAHAWNQPSLIYAVTIAAIAFCLMSSGIYIINDIIDRESDRKHPSKKHRPLASGVLTINATLPIAMLLFIISLLLGFAVSMQVGIILVTYAVMNILYCLHLKQIVILDVFIIAFGFMLRILAGTWGVGIIPSQWLMLCGLMITLFLGFTKRRAELGAVSNNQHTHRAVLNHYSADILDKLIGITATGAILTYSLYTVSPDTVHAQGTKHLIYTVPFVIYGIFRYIYLVHNNMQHKGEDTSTDLLRDPHMLITVGAWFVLVIYLIH